MNKLENSEKSFALEKMEQTKSVFFSGLTENLSNQLKIEVTMFRALLIFLCLINGAGILIYAFLLAIFPQKITTINYNNLIGSLLITISVYSFMNIIGLAKYILYFPFPDLIMPILIIFYSIFLFRSDYKPQIKPAKRFIIKKNGDSVLGVSYALAKFLDLKPAIVRLGFIFFTFATIGGFSVIYFLIYYFSEKVNE